ncbi:peptidase inhibitor family I36 protein [Streptosporangium carneum]|uniref:Peptidase inhibitor family I36 n=1 Tax=Streptosporangium carneum TaxID=47481 RepID=A0A9W6HWJ1_9ACTN|nr:hypothetical protein GCM10017600_01150 [Streptosporangium carneum]
MLKGAIFRSVAAVAIAGGLVGASTVAPAQADSTCASSNFCAWTDISYYGSKASATVAVEEWHQAAGSLSAWKVLVTDDASWKNRFTTLYWVCVYDTGFYVGPTVWLRQNQSFSSVQSGMQDNSGDSHRGRSSTQTC